MLCEWLFQDISRMHLFQDQQEKSLFQDTPNPPHSHRFLHAPGQQEMITNLYFMRSLELTLVEETPKLMLWAILVIRPTKSPPLKFQCLLGFRNLEFQRRWIKVWCFTTMAKECLYQDHAFGHLQGSKNSFPTTMPFRKFSRNEECTCFIPQCHKLFQALGCR